MSLAAVDAAIDGASRRTTLLTVIIAAIATLLVTWLLYTGVLRPVHRITEGTRKVAEGDLDHAIDLSSATELGDLAAAFDRMTSALKREKLENEEWSRTLQERIDEKTAELRAAQEQMIHVEKMASLGRLSATVAHELNNPLEAILTYAKLIGRRLTRGAADAEGLKRSGEEVATIARETERCGAIVKSLLLFSKRQVGAYAFVPVRQMIERALRLVEHHCSISNVTVDAPLPPEEITLMCNEGQIEQALVALFVNAVEAMPGGGTLRVGASAAPSDGPITLTVADTGSGIAPEDLPHIFEPFFTTKRDGKGVGLGLAVVYGIVEHHGGTITVKSAAGQGTAFTLQFPRAGVPDHNEREATLHEAAV
jgi:two-component system NtrC family sensor kinase